MLWLTTKPINNYSISQPSIMTNENFIIEYPFENFNITILTRDDEINTNHGPHSRTRFENFSKMCTMYLYCRGFWPIFFPT